MLWLHVKLFVHLRRPFLSRMYGSYSVPRSHRQYWVGKACECRGSCNSVKLYEAFAACHAQRSAKAHLSIRRGQVHRVFVWGHAFCLCVCVCMLVYRGASVFPERFLTCGCKSRLPGLTDLSGCRHGTPFLVRWSEDAWLSPVRNSRWCMPDSSETSRTERHIFKTLVCLLC